MTVQSNEVPFLVIAETSQPTRRGIELQVWDRADPTHLVNVVARRVAPKWLDEHNRDGGGSFRIRVDDPVFLDSPNLLDEGNVVEVIVAGRTVGWWEILNKPRDTIPEGEYSGEWFDVSGPGLYSWLRHAVLYPVGGPIKQASDTRTFNFAGPTGPWYDPTKWAPPVQIATWDTVGSPWEGYPLRANPVDSTGWPVDSAWVWDRSGDAPDGDVYFRTEFTTVGVTAIRIFATVDDVCAVYVDGQPMLSVTEFYAWKRQFSVDLSLTAGTHVLAVHARNRGMSPAGLNVAVVKIPDTGDITNADRLAWTGGVGWVCNGYPTSPPGWSSGLVLTSLLAEATARNVRTLAWLPASFTGTVDTYGMPWQDALDWSWEVGGTTYRDIAAQFTDTVADLWIDDQRRLCMAPYRGFDRSVQNAGIQPVILAMGLNVTGAKVDSQAEIVNTVLMKTSDGWSEVNDTVGSTAVYGRRESYLSAVDASEHGVASRLAQQVFDKYAKPRRSPTVTIVGIAEHLPWRDFQVADWVLAPDDDNPVVLIKRRIVSISVEEDGNTGEPLYSCEIDTILEVNAERVARWLSTTGKGSLSGGVSGTSGSSPTAPLGVTSVMPAGTPGPPGKVGPVGVVWRGAYSAVTAYVKGDLVRFDRQTWQALSEVVNVTPVEGAVWSLLAAAGLPGDNGLSAYAEAVAGGFVGTQVAWLVSLQGSKGDAGVGVPVGGTTGQVLSKTSAADFATQWIPPAAGGGGVPAGGVDGQLLGVVASTPAWVAAPTGSSGSNLADAFKGPWSASTSYVKGDVVYADAGTGLTSWVAVIDQPARTTSHVGGTSRVNAGDLAVAPATVAGDTLLLVHTGHPIDPVPTAPSGWALVGRFAGTYARVDVFTKSAISASDSVTVPGIDSSAWSLRTYRGVSAPTAIIAGGGNTNTAAALVGALVGVWSAGYGTALSAPAGLAYTQVIQAVRYQVIGLLPSNAAVTVTNAAIWATVSIGVGTTPFIPGAAWIVLVPTGSAKRTVDGTAPPTVGDWQVGDQVRNTAPTAGGFTGWVCTTAGTPGTWNGFGVIAA